MTAPVNQFTAQPPPSRPPSLTRSYARDPGLKDAQISAVKPFEKRKCNVETGRAVINVNKKFHSIRKEAFSKEIHLKIRNLHMKNSNTHLQTVR
jgi:hypothetical protein